MNVPPRFRVNKATAIMYAKAMLGAGDYLKGRYVMQCPKCGRTAIEALRQDMISDEIALKCKYWKCGHVFRVHLLTPAMIEAVGRLKTESEERFRRVGDGDGGFIPVTSGYLIGPILYHDILDTFADMLKGGA